MLRANVQHCLGVISILAHPLMFNLSSWEAVTALPLLNLMRPFQVISGQVSPTKLFTDCISIYYISISSHNSPHPASVARVSI